MSTLGACETAQYNWPYWEGLHTISVCIALDAATPANGCLKMLPGSHKSVISTYRSASEPDLDYRGSVAKEIVRGKALS